MMTSFWQATHSCVSLRKNCMELIFLFTGWEFATEGKKATNFSEICCALGVAFNLTRSCEGVLEIQNTESRIVDLVQQLAAVISVRKLNRTDALKLRGRLGFADGFLHGRLGALVLKRLIDHAYGSTTTVDDDLANILHMMSLRLQTAKPKLVDSQAFKEWLIFTDAAYGKENKHGGLGAVLIDSSGDCVAWFSLPLDGHVCCVLGADGKGNNYI